MWQPAATIAQKSIFSQLHVPGFPGFPEAGKPGALASGIPGGLPRAHADIVSRPIANYSLENVMHSC